MSNEEVQFKSGRWPLTLNNADQFTRNVEILARVGYDWLKANPEAVRVVGKSLRSIKNYLTLHANLHPDVWGLVANRAPSVDPAKGVGKLVREHLHGRYGRPGRWLPADHQRRVCTVLLREAGLDWNVELRLAKTDTGEDSHQRFVSRLDLANNDPAGFQQRALGAEGDEPRAKAVFRCILGLVLRDHPGGLESPLAHRIIQQEFDLPSAWTDAIPPGSEPRWRGLLLQEVEGFRNAGWLDVGASSGLWRLSDEGLLAAQDVGLDDLLEIEQEIVRPFLLRGEASDDTDSAGSVRQREMREIWARRGQPRFRRELLRVYMARCAVSETDSIHVLEACHLVPVAEGGTDAMSNGVLLRSDLHTLFDLDLVGINPVGLIVVVSPRLAETEYQSLHGRELHFPADPDGRPEGQALRYRWERFLSAQPG